MTTRLAAALNKTDLGKHERIMPTPLGHPSRFNGSGVLVRRSIYARVQLGTSSGSGRSR